MPGQATAARAWGSILPENAGSSCTVPAAGLPLTKLLPTGRSMGIRPIGGPAAPSSGQGVVPSTNPSELRRSPGLDYRKPRLRASPSARSTSHYSAAALAASVAQPVVAGAEVGSPRQTGSRGQVPAARPDQAPRDPALLAGYAQDVSGCAKGDDERANNPPLSGKDGT